MPKADLLGAIQKIYPNATAPLTGRFSLWGGTSNNGSSLTADVTCTTSNGSNVTLSSSGSQTVVIGTFVVITP